MPRDWRYEAGRLWSVLTGTAACGDTVTYVELATVIGTAALSVRHALDVIRDYCGESGLPALTCIVVNASTGLPGSGCGAATRKEMDDAQRRVWAHDWTLIANPFPGPSTASSGIARDEVRRRDCASDDSSVIVPTDAELEEVVRGFDEVWGGVDRVLYDVCKRGSHTERRDVMTKSILVERVYSAGLERFASPGEPGKAAEAIGDCLTRHGDRVARIVSGLDAVSEPLTAQGMAAVVTQHGRLVALLREELTGKQAPRSFASKYLHFHRPDVPIYDSYCDAELTRRVRWDRQRICFVQPDEADPAYYRFCIRFLRLYKACRAAGLSRPPSVKDLDALLWRPAR